jgi:transcriptional regulator with XRE-family HTH domain
LQLFIFRAVCLKANLHFIKITIMEKITEKIKEYRKKKGYNYEIMAHEMKISTAAYRKIETNQTKLTVDKLYQIAEIIEAKIEDLLDIQADKIYHQTNNDNAVGYQEVQNLYQDNKEKSEKIELLYESRLKDKDFIIFSQAKRITELENKLKEKL